MDKKKTTEKKTERNILVAFLLNILFCIIELIGGFFTNSVAILSSSVHDFGDALSIGISYFLEHKSKKKPNKKYTYGYLRYSILGAFITTTILLIGSVFVIKESIERIINPVEVNYDGMIIFAVLGCIINLIANLITRGGKSLNQKSVNLHMLEDVFNWLVILIGSILMKFTNIKYIDPILSIFVSLIIFVSAFKNLKRIIDIFLVKTPNDINIDELSEHLLKVEGVKDIHHIHVWTMDNINNYATLHVSTNEKNYSKIKHNIREEMEEHGINHVTIEIEEPNEDCEEEVCEIKTDEEGLHHHHHH